MRAAPSVSSRDRRRPARPRRCAPASRSGSSRAGTPIGAIPADAGVPPRFDFAGSQNVKAVEVHVARAAAYPGGEPGRDRVYRRHDPAACDRAAERGEAGACCVSSSTMRCARSCACRPKARPSWCSPAARPRTTPRSPRPRRGCRRRSRSAKARRSPSGRCDARMAPRRPRIVVDVAAPSGADVALFAEGPTPEWALPVPAPRSTVRRPACSASPSSSTARRPGPSTTAPPSPSPQLRADAAVEVAAHLD